ncbi:hypothetical protein BH10BDE1_BH10BDE1_05100 [soil metagenome]
MNTFLKVGVVLSVGIIASTGWAAKGPMKNQMRSVNPASFNLESPEDGYRYMTDEQFTALKKSAPSKSLDRQPTAKTDFIDPSVKFTPQYLNLQAKLIGGPIYDVKTRQKTGQNEPGVKTADELALLIKAADDDAMYEQLPIDAKFIAASLATMKPYRGLAFRARPLFSTSKLVHAYMISGMRLAATGINVFMPTPQWKAGFKYFSEPSATKYRTLTADQLKSAPQNAEERTATFISDELTFFHFVNFEVLPTMNKYAMRLQALVETSEQKGFKPFYFDNQLVISTANFADDHDRLVRIAEPELRMALASVLGSRSGMYASLAYSWKGLFAAVEGMGRNVGFQTLFNVDLTTAKQRNKQLAQPGLFVLQSPKKMGRAYDDLKEAARQTQLAWDAVKGDHSVPAANQIAPLLDPRVLTPFTRQIDAGVANVNSLFEVRPGTLGSAVVQGEAVQVDLYKFFHGETIPKDLKAFMPTGYVAGPREFTDTPLALTAGAPIRNYLEGSPEHWNIPVYQTYFPNVQSDQDVIKAARVLSQAWGGWVIGFPFAAMVL